MQVEHVAYTIMFCATALATALLMARSLTTLGSRLLAHWLSAHDSRLTGSRLTGSWLISHGSQAHGSRFIGSRFIDSLAHGSQPTTHWPMTHGSRRTGSRFIDLRLIPRFIDSLAHCPRTHWLTAHDLATPRRRWLKSFPRAGCCRDVLDRLHSDRERISSPQVSVECREKGDDEVNEESNPVSHELGP